MKLVWDAQGEKRYHTGIDRAVLYLLSEAGVYDTGFAWNGITGVTESPSGAEATPLYADNIKYLNLVSAEEYACTLEAYMFPEQFKDCDGSKSDLAPGITIGQQDRKVFGLSYRTIIGDDVKGNAKGYKIHLVYGCNAAPSEKNYQSINDSPEAITFSWEINTTPVPVTGAKPTATLEIDSTTIAADKLTALEDILYGKDATEPRLPLPDEIITLVKAV